MSISVIVVGFGDEPVLDECLSSIREQLGPDDDLVLVDHGITTAPVSAVRTVVPSLNGGFGAGCAAGVLATQGDTLVFVNSDAVLLPGALKALTSRLDDPTVGMVASCVVLADHPETINSTGLPVHLSGLSWCDGYGDPVERHQEAKEVASVAGAFFACSRVVWQRLGGMDESYFMYHEDTDLSLRCHLAGLRVVYCPDAVALHAYDFSRNAGKMYLLERNRFLTVLADFPDPPAAARAAGDRAAGAALPGHRAARRVGPREGARLGLAAAARRGRCVHGGAGCRPRCGMPRARCSPRAGGHPDTARRHRRRSPCSTTC